MSAKHIIPPRTLFPLVCTGMCVKRESGNKTVVPLLLISAFDISQIKSMLPVKQTWLSKFATYEIHKFKEEQIGVYVILNLTALKIPWVQIPPENILLKVFQKQYFALQISTFYLAHSVP